MLVGSLALGSGCSRSKDEPPKTVDALVETLDHKAAICTHNHKEFAALRDSVARKLQEYLHEKKYHGANRDSVYTFHSKGYAFPKAKPHRPGEFDLYEFNERMTMEDYAETAAAESTRAEKYYEMISTIQGIASHR